MYYVYLGVFNRRVCHKRWYRAV